MHDGARASVRKLLHLDIVGAVEQAVAFVGDDRLDVDIAAAEIDDDATAALLDDVAAILIAIAAIVPIVLIALVLVASGDCGRGGCYCCCSGCSARAAGAIACCS